MFVIVKCFCIGLFWGRWVLFRCSCDSLTHGLWFMVLIFFFFFRSTVLFSIFSLSFSQPLPFPHPFLCISPGRHLRMALR